MASVKREETEKVSDLRVVFAGNELQRSRALELQFPPMYSPTLVPAIPEDERVNSSGLDALIVVIRRLVSHISGEYSDPSIPEIAQQEQANPLLRLAMSHFDNESQTNLGVAGYHALKAFYGGEKLKAHKLTFMALSEHQLMLKTFWSRERFLLYQPTFLFRMGDQYEWDFYDYSGEPEELARLAARSLVRFKTGNLSEAVERRFNPGMLRWMASNMPSVLRVHYTVDKSEPKTMHDLQAITVDMRHMTKGSQGYELAEKGSCLTHYGLIAEVRLSRDGKEKDTVRTYAHGGEVISMPAEFPPTHKELLGEPGASYLLYYGALASPRVPREYRIKVLKRNEMSEAIDRQFADLVSGSPSGNSAVKSEP
ncbi:uncharacterized protein F4807DRAFT_469352 [Annulohypoxylon truncatum]|uniref:uncharacterized protein n=1 Tax=Annulohypoxylon truncatum TaxID=327061 RepID=UPI002008579A|nr:uncharacterized protein F4807DRAFT_469352 [Annulohypoxylon truncatum]KAI1207558.1 hypothetical protein F4807DRAFT_469352 [Annulohypoxylon truncatum]